MADVRFCQQREGNAAPSLAVNGATSAVTARARATRVVNDWHSDCVYAAATIRTQLPRTQQVVGAWLQVDRESQRGQRAYAPPRSAARRPREGFHYSLLAKAFQIFNCTFLEEQQKETGASLFKRGEREG